MKLNLFQQDMVEYVGFSGENLELYILDNSFLAIGCFSAIKVSDMALLGTNDESCNKNGDELEKSPDFYPRYNIFKVELYHILF